MEATEYGKIRSLAEGINHQLVRSVSEPGCSGPIQLISVANAVAGMFELEAICASIEDLDARISLTEKLGRYLGQSLGTNRTQDHITFLRNNWAILRDLDEIIGRLGNLGGLRDTVTAIQHAVSELRQGHELPGAIATVDFDQTKTRLEALKEFCALIPTIRWQS